MTKTFDYKGKTYKSEFELLKNIDLETFVDDDVVVNYKQTKEDYDAVAAAKRLYDYHLDNSCDTCIFGSSGAYACSLLHVFRFLGFTGQ